MDATGREVSGARVIPRPRLLRILAGSWKVALLSAPAGFGKSTLADQYAQTRAAIRCRLHAEDQDPARLLSTILIAGSRLHPPVGGRTRELFDARREMERDGGLLTASLIDELVPRRGERLIVLEDVHVLAGAREALQMLRRIMEETGPRVRFLLTCRGTSPIPIARFDLMGGTRMVGAEDLAFTAEEQDRLLRHGFGLRLAREDRSALGGAMGGWAAGIVLAARQALQTGRTPAYAPGAPDERMTSRAFAFLAEEVYAPLPNSLKHSLCRAAVLDELEPELARAVLGAKEAASLIAEVRRRDLFLQGAGAGLGRFHPLFREYLLDRLAESEPRGDRLALYQRLARAYRDAGDGERAVRALLKAEDADGALALFVKMAEGRTPLRSPAFLPSLATELLSSDVRTPRIERSAWVAHYASFEKRRAGHYDDAIALSRAAQETWLREHAYLRAARAFKNENRTAILVGRVTEGIRRARSMRAAIPATAWAARGLVDLEYGYLQLVAGKSDQARRRISGVRRALAAAGDRAELAETPVSLAEASISLAEVAFTQGRWERYVSEAQANLAPLRRAGLFGRVQTLLINIADACIYLGEEDRALAHLDEAWSLRARSHVPHNLASIATYRGRALLEAGSIDEAEGRFREARNLLGELPSLMGSLQLDLWEGIMERRRGNLAAARALLSRAAGGFAGTQATTWLSVARMERALVAGLLGETKPALADLRASASVSRQMGDRKELARNVLFEARVLQAARQSSRAVFVRALRMLDREAYFVLLRKEADVCLPLLSDPQLRPTGALFARSMAALPEDVRERVLRASGRGGVAVRTDRSAAAPPALRINLLGGFEAWVGDRRITFSRRASEALVAYLALRRGEPVPWDVLAEALWPAAPADSSRNRFDVALNGARRALEPDAGPRGPYRLIVTEAGWCRLARGTLATDVDLFDARVRLCESDLQKIARRPWSRSDEIKGPDARRAHARMRSALDVYRGGLLPELIYSSWTSGERERLRGRYLRLLTGLGVVALSLGRIDEAEESASTALGEDPLLEEAQRLLMRVLAARGDHAGVAQSYRSFVKRMRTGLATAPSPDTCALYRELVGAGR